MPRAECGAKWRYDWLGRLQWELHSSVKTGAAQSAFDSVLHAASSHLSSSGHFKVLLVWATPSRLTRRNGSIRILLTAFSIMPGLQSPAARSLDQISCPVQ